MQTDVILITGAAGEIGHALITHFAEYGGQNVIALDVNPIPEPLKAKVFKTLTGDITDEKMWEQFSHRFNAHVIYHLAALLSSSGERSPETAHRVNVNGMFNLIRMAVQHSERIGQPVKFMFPSSVAVYGLPDLATKASAGAVREEEYNAPFTMYGCNKLYGEHVGRYYTHHYRQLDATYSAPRIDFRALRFPGLISAFTVPTGGTSDYGPEMLHHAARGKPYTCFVREDTRMPFMAMPDAVRALTMLESTPQEKLTSTVYNVTSFNPSAGEIYMRAAHAFPGARVTFEPHGPRQRIVDSWPQDVDDSRAHRDWDWSPEYGEHRAFEEYLIPNIQARYQMR